MQTDVHWGPVVRVRSPHCFQFALCFCLQLKTSQLPALLSRLPCLCGFSLWNHSLNKHSFFFLCVALLMVFYYNRKMNNTYINIIIFISFHKISSVINLNLSVWRSRQKAGFQFFLYTLKPRTGRARRRHGDYFSCV